ncbi:MAG: DUF6036 family nucleotidyltransferase [Phycisphaerae bacterium]
MTGKHHGPSEILSAFQLAGEKLDWPSEVELVIVGGAAGMLLGIWHAERVTEDADIVEISPPTQPRRAVLQAAKEAAEELGLSPHWLNDDFMAFGTLDTLPDGWRQRCVEIGRFGKLRITSLGRQDLLAMKVYAARPQDIEDVLACSETLTHDDLSFIRRYLDSLRASHRKQIGADQLGRAFAVLDSLSEEIDP